MARKIKELIPEDFERAAEILDERGWTRKTLMDEQGSVCMLGALYFAAGERAGVKHAIKHTDYGFGVDVAKSVTDIRIPDCSVVRQAELPVWADTYTWSDITLWNDTRARGKKAVQSKLRRIAKLLRRQQKVQA